jgi:hypothetical protein
MKTVLIVIGHYNAESITSQGLRSWRDWNYLRRSTGASGERDFNYKVMEKLRDKLIAAGVQVYIHDATYKTEVYNRNYDLLVTLHYDAGGTEERCMIAAPKRGQTPPYLFEQAQVLSEKFADIWRRVYPQVVGVPNRDNRITEGMTDHYLWDYVKEGTPCAIIEHFNHTSPKGTELKKNPELVAEGDFKAIREFLGIQAPAPTPDPAPIDELYRVTYKGKQLAALRENPIDKINNFEKKFGEIKELSDKLSEKVK